MIRVALKGLLGRKLRFALTAVAVVLGVAMVSGTYVLTDTIKKGFNTIFTVSYQNADAVITGKLSFGNVNETTPPSFDASLLPRVRALPDVADAVGSISDFAPLVGRNGKVLTTSGAPNLAFSVDPDEGSEFNPLTLVHGTWPRGPDEIAIDAATASKHHYAIGQTIGVQARGAVRRFRITGIAELGAVSSIGGATIAIFDVPTAQRLFHKVGKFDAIRVAAKRGASKQQLLANIRKLLPRGTQVRSGTAQAKQDASDTSGFVSILQKFLLAFGFVALFVGSFVIANTLSITIAQRTRELATLRTLGATRRQVRRSILLEALVLGVVASLVGLGLGVLLAKGLDGLFDAFGIDLPKSGTVFATRTVVVSLAVGILVTLVASLRPAVRATRVPPIAAVREGSVLQAPRLARFGPLVALVILAAAVALMSVGAFTSGIKTEDRLFMLGAGVLLLFVGVAILASRLVKPLARVLGIPAARSGAAGVLAQANAMRNPARTASTAAALMIGLALVTFVAVLATGLKREFNGAVDRVYRGDYALTATNNFSPFDISAVRAVARVPGVRVAGVRAGQGRAEGSSIGVTGVDPGISSVLSLAWERGGQASLEGLGTTGAVVDHDFAKDNHLSLGSPLALKTPYGQTLHLRVAGIFKPPKGGSPLGSVTISSRLFDASYTSPEDVFAFVRIAGGQSHAALARLSRALASYPDAKVVTLSVFKKHQVSSIDQLLNLLYVLLSLSVIVSLFGIVNTLVLTVFERTREIGMLRAIGMTRRQVRRMIRHESVVTALIGAALGIPLGIALAVFIEHAIDYGEFAVPIGTLVVFVIAAVIAGLVAAIFPARRASRLNVLEALQYE